MTVSPYTIYNIGTGFIVNNGVIIDTDDNIVPTAEAQLSLFEEGTHALLYESGSPDLHYIGYGENGARVLVDRPEPRVLIDKTSITADGIDISTLSRLPPTGEILIDDNVPDTDDPDPISLSGQATWTFAADTPGTYTVIVRSWPTLDAVFEITAT